MYLLQARKATKIQDVKICQKHWKEWYNFNYRLKTILKKNKEKENVQIEQASLVNSIEARSALISLGDTRKLEDLIVLGFSVNHILRYLDFFSLKRLSLTCRIWCNKIKDYLSNEFVWQGFLKKQFLVTRPLSGMSCKESFQAILKYHLQFSTMFHLDDKGFQFLLRNFSLFCQSIQDGNSNICKIFKKFGIERELTSLEALVCFTAQKVKPVFDKHHSLLKKCRSGLLPCGFRVGPEVTNIPFAALLYDLILTGNENMIPAEPCKRPICSSFYFLTQ